MIVATYVVQVIFSALGVGAGIAGLHALVDGRFPVGGALFVASCAFAAAEHACRRLRAYLAERDRLG